MNLNANFATKTVSQLKEMLRGWGIDFAPNDKKHKLLDLADRYAVRHGACPSAASTREPGFDPGSWTVSQLRRFLISQGIAYPSNSLKEDFLQVFAENAELCGYGDAVVPTVENDGDGDGEGNGHVGAAVIGAGPRSQRAESQSQQPLPRMNDAPVAATRRVRSVTATTRDESPAVNHARSTPTQVAFHPSTITDDDDEDLVENPHAASSLGRTPLQASRQSQPRSDSEPEAILCPDFSSTASSLAQPYSAKIHRRGMSSQSVKSVLNPGQPCHAIGRDDMERLIELLARCLECLGSGDEDRAKLLAIEAIIKF